MTLLVCATLADFSATSGKSHDYAGGSERVRSGPTGNRRWRTMFVASVAAGKAFCDLQGEALFSGRSGGSGGAAGH